MGNILRHGFRLGDRHVSPTEGWIQGPDGPEHVQPKVMDVLLCLAEKPGEVVERDEIVIAVWGDLAVGRDALTRCISDLRHHLRDHSDRPEFIRTIPKRGYQLIAAVETASATDPVTPNPGSDDTYTFAFLTFIENLRRRRVFRAVGLYAIFAWVAMQVADVVIEPLGFPVWTMTAIVWIAVLGFPLTVIFAWTLQITGQGVVIDRGIAGPSDRINVVRLRVADYAIIVVLLLITSTLTYQLIDNRDRPLTIQTESGPFELPRINTSLVDPNSIAVLPFLNIGDDPRIEYLGVGLAEEVLNLLANVNELKVLSRQSSFQYRDSTVDIQTIANELRVKNILEGSIQGQLDDLRITAQLIDADSGFHLWSDTFTPQSSNMLLIRDEIAQAVVESLKIVLSVESRTRLATAPTQSADAYEYYLQALSYLRRPKTEQTLDNAQGLFRRAIDLDPDYAKAYAGLCEVLLGKYQLSLQTEHVQPAERACQTALSHDPSLPEVHSALGNLYRRTGDYEKAGLEFQRAIVLDPRLEPAYYGLGRVYMAQNRLSEAEDILKYSVDLEPGYWGTHLGLGNYYLNFGQPEKAIEPFQRVTEINPDYAMGFNNLGAAYYNSGDLENGEKAFLASLEMSPTRLALSNVGTIYYNTARYAEAAEMFRKAVDLTPHDYTLWGRLAAANRRFPGRETEAEQQFQTAIELAEDNLQINPNDSNLLAYAASYYANVNDETKARNAIQRALEIAPHDPHVHYFAAHVGVIFGDIDGALSSLETAADLGYSIDAIEADPEFTPLRTNARYRAIFN